MARSRRRSAAARGWTAGPPGERAARCRNNTGGSRRRGSAGGRRCASLAGHVRPHAQRAARKLVDQLAGARDPDRCRCPTAMNRCIRPGRRDQLETVSAIREVRGAVPRCAGPRPEVRRRGSGSNQLRFPEERLVMRSPKRKRLRGVSPLSRCECFLAYAVLYMVQRRAPAAPHRGSSRPRFPTRSARPQQKPLGEKGLLRPGPCGLTWPARSPAPGPRPDPS